MRTYWAIRAGLDMSRYILRYVRAWLTSSLALILLVGIPYSLLGGRGGFYFGLRFLPIISASFLLLNGSLDYWYLRKVMKKYGVNDFNLTQSREVFVPGKIADLVNRARLIVDSTEGILSRSVQVTREEQSTARIVAKRRKHWQLVGEKLELRFREFGVGVRVAVTSKSYPRLTAVYDAGRNIENVEEICAKFKSSAVLETDTRPG